MARGKKGGALWTCPEHGLLVEHKVRRIRDDDGSDRYGGEYFGCPKYGRGCDYAVGLKSGKATGKTARKHELARLTDEQRQDARSS